MWRHVRPLASGHHSRIHTTGKITCRRKARRKAGCKHRRPAGNKLSQVCLAAGDLLSVSTGVPQSSFLLTIPTQFILVETTFLNQLTAEITGRSSVLTLRPMIRRNTVNPLEGSLSIRRGQKGTALLPQYPNHRSRQASYGSARMTPMSS